QAYDEFVPLDGKFRDNVMVQVKNGALDFQPREPFHPIFGAMPKTPLVLELQITKEYLGEDSHLVYLAPMFEEVLRADTHRGGRGSTVGKVIDGSLHGYRHTELRAWRTLVTTPTGLARSSIRPTGTRTAGWPGITAFR